VDVLTKSSLVDRLIMNLNSTKYSPTDTDLINIPTQHEVLTGADRINNINAASEAMDDVIANVFSDSDTRIAARAISLSDISDAAAGATVGANSTVCNCEINEECDECNAIEYFDPLGAFGQSASMSRWRDAPLSIYDDYSSEDENDAVSNAVINDSDKCDVVSFYKNGKPVYTFKVKAGSDPKAKYPIHWAKGSGMLYQTETVLF